jgi:enoyl-CoA hydratase
MDEKLLLIEKQERVCTISFNQPERRNILSPLLLIQLADTLAEIQKEGEIRCVVIRGVGDKAFSAGYDIGVIPTNPTPEMAEAFKTKNPLRTGLQAIVHFPYPVIAMVNGLAYGAGCELATTCDLRIAADHVRFSMPPAKLGVVYQWEGLRQFINIIGLANTKEMFLTGRAYEAQRAKEMGLVHYVLPPDQLAPFTYAMAKEISENAPLALSSGKRIMNFFLENQNLDPEMLKEIEVLRMQAFNSEDLKEGQRAFKEKRKPVFKGR